MTITTTSRPDPRAPTPQHPVRVVVVDRDRTVRDAIADLLEIDPTISVVGEADTLHRALTLLPGLAPDVVIIDPRLPDGDGLRICRNLKATKAATRCLVLTSQVEPEAMLDAVHAGAAGYMIKDLTELALGDAVKAIAAGKSRLDSHSTPVLMNEFRRRHSDQRALLASLTTMEMTILLLLAEGLSNKQIASRMFFTENTVRAYIARLMSKLGIDTPAQAGVYAAQLRNA
ncbi:response regulator [Nocardia sp. ET3-3]|uniref:Response regulator n=1 Tax=Nocardia terrae TaxID=2675851 RepID=A0A7K1UT76_9NOCA|nr:response regulator transcription factor [Nocardia terrae]MVU77562.1 response regulator [Nocardia terrae]